jgi:hypothetical protein
MNEITHTLIELWKYDIEVFSQPWIYWPFCVPALAYLSFFFAKWVAITAPIWLPFVIIIRSFRGDQ